MNLFTESRVLEITRKVSSSFSLKMKLILKRFLILRMKTSLSTKKRIFHNSSNTTLKRFWQKRSLGPSLLETSQLSLTKKPPRQDLKNMDLLKKLNSIRHITQYIKWLKLLILIQTLLKESVELIGPSFLKVNVSAYIPLI